MVLNIESLVNKLVLNTVELKEACQTILYAIDNKDSSLFTETLELVSDGTILNLNVTNREYYCNYKLALPEKSKFKAAVNAKIFLSLISKITTDTIDLSISKNTLKVKANGEYTLPMIYNDDVMLELPKIDLGKVTNEMVINSSTLLSILANNSKELLRGIAVKPVQKYYYIDELGAITFTTGACVNSFTLPNKVKMLLSEKVVKLFKLFKTDCDVNFYIGQVQLSDEVIQTVVRFKTDKVEITAKLPDSSLISGVPVSGIRGMATKNYPCTMVLDKNLLLQSLNRIMIFNEEAKTYGNIIAKGNSLTLQDFNGGSKESITSTDENTKIKEYKMILDLKNLKLVLDGCEDEYITMCFGDSRAVVIKKQSITDIIPELRINE